MSFIRSAMTIVLALALAGGLTANVAYADLPNTPANVKVMDRNKNGKIEREEYLAYMGRRFDELAGGKGYCTYEEVSAGLRKLGSAFPVDNSRD